MTETEQERAAREAREDARKMSLALLALYRDQSGFQGHTITYDSAIARFRIDGKPVSPASIRAQLAKIQDKFSRRLLLLTTQLENNQISFAQWQREFERSISSAQILAGALVLGSIAAATANRTIQRYIAEQWRFSDGFANDLRSRAVLPRVGFLPERGETVGAETVTFRGLSSAKIHARAKSYTHAIHLTYTNVELEVQSFLGVNTEAKRVLTFAEHCRDSKAGVFGPARHGCLELADRGWMDIHEMIPIGGATCGIWCKCFIIYR